MLPFRSSGSLRRGARALTRASPLALETITHRRITNASLKQPPRQVQGLPYDWTLLQHRSMVMVTKTKVGETPPPVSVRATPDTTPLDAPHNDAATLSVNGQESIGITQSCWKQILFLASRKEIAPTDLFLRLFVDAGGCSGFQYAFEIETETTLEDDDVVWMGPEGARVVIDESSLEFVRGATLDYVTEMIKSAFTVLENPQSEAACGCGSSFAVKNFAANPALD
jgi:iron-sulfur cluster assembly accessory protein